MTKIRRRNGLPHFSLLRRTYYEKIALILTTIMVLSIIGIINRTNELRFNKYQSPPPPCDDNIQSTKPISSSNNTSSLYKPSTLSSDNIAIFYNTFFAEDKQKSFLALSFIKEQLHSRSTSIYPNASLYYISLGEDIKIPNCTNCKQLEYIPKGNEVSTLSKLYEFCIEHPDKNVAYIHNKGSFHPSRNNDLLRRMLTKAVFSEECLLLKNPHKSKRSIDTSSHCQCNVCSARFSPLPHFHTPGNMWVSTCSYVSKLIPPDIFGKKMDNATECASTERFGRASKIAGTHVGRGRFAAEHWINSHPDVCPCDVYPGTFLWAYERLPSNDNWKPDLVYAPRFPMIEDYEEEEYLLSVRKTIQGAWFSLVGRIHEWKTVYGKIPDENSWVWNYYKSSEGYGAKE